MPYVVEDIDVLIMQDVDLSHSLEHRLQLGTTCEFFPFYDFKRIAEVAVHDSFQLICIILQVLM